MDTANEWYTGAWAQAFRGHLDGGYHTISGLYLNKTKDNYTGTDYYGGLFACIGKNAVIEKLGIVNSSLTFTNAVSTKYLGVFAGFVDQYDSSKEKASPDEYPIIRECFADTTVELDGSSCGGFIGCATRPIRVEDSYFTGKVKSTSRGLFGYSKMGYTVDEALVKNFYTADSKYAVFSNASYDNIKCENCYSSAAQDKEGLTRLFIDKMLGKEAKKNMKVMDVKEVQLSVNIGQHDFDTKLKAARKFLEAGDKVKISLRLKGRQLAFADKGIDMVNSFINMCGDISSVEKAPTLDGKLIMGFITPKSQKK
jgi:hypothetical protein